MKGKLGILLIVLVLLLAAPALASRGQPEQPGAGRGRPLVDNLLAGFNQGNYAQYSRDFDDTLREAIPEKKFQQVRADILKKLGKYKEKISGLFKSAGPHHGAVERRF
jgi:hypothetical protein